jgi:hypothetical protein
LLEVFLQAVGKHLPAFAQARCSITGPGRRRFDRVAVLVELALAARSGFDRKRLAHARPDAVRGAPLAGDELIRQHFDQQQLHGNAVPERILFVAADAHALAQVRRAGEHRRFPVQAGLAQALAKVLVEVQQAGFVTQTLAVGRVADHQAFLVLVRARLEGRDFALVDLDPLAQAGTLDVVAARLDQARVGFVAANPQRRLGRPAAARSTASSWSFSTTPARGRARR